MRRLVPLFLVFALLAGCFGDGGGSPPPATSSPAASPPAPSPTPAPPVVPPTPTPTAPAPQPKVVYNGSHDFTGPPPLPNAPPRTENFTVDAGYATLQVRIVFAAATSGPTGDVTLSAQATVRVVDPAGAAVIECTGKDDPDCSKDLPTPAAGAWKVEYSGSGTSKATVSITEAP